MFYCGLDFAMKSSYVYITDSQGRKKTSGEVETGKAALTRRLRQNLLIVSASGPSQAAMMLHDLH